MTDRVTFNLLDEPWIQVITTDGAPATLSLLDVFRDASQIRRIAGELPTQDAAVLRLLLAILYRAVPMADGDEESLTEVWGEWWNDRALPLDQVQEYLSHYRDRFDLFDPAVPFFQVADLHTASGNTPGIGVLIADLPAGHKLFTNRAGAGAVTLSHAEAARWLVHCHAFDFSGIKSGAVGDDRVKGGRGYPIGTGWAGNLGLVILEGEDLAETLLLNLVLATPSRDEDRPPWEVERWTAAQTGQDSPAGPAQAMTWQSRRIRMWTDGKQVHDALVSIGDKIRVRNQNAVEPMSGWRRSAAQEKQHKESLVYMPRTYGSERNIWRGLTTLLVGDARGVGTAAPEGIRAGSIRWLSMLREHERIAPDEFVSLHVVCMAYGTHNASVTDILSDRLTIRAQVARDPQLQERAERAVQTAELAARLLGRLADNLAKAEGRDRAADRERRQERTYQLLDPHFRAWLEGLNQEGASAHEARWVARVRDEALASAQEMYGACGAAAIKGRITFDQAGKPVRLDAAQAYQWFRRQLDKDMPPPDDEQDRGDRDE